MDLRLEGELNLWQGVFLAAVSASLLWFVYRRELVRRQGRAAWLLPTVRAAAVILVMLMLTGPVLHGTIEVGDRSRVLVVVDESQSMGLVDMTISKNRKLTLARQMGWLSDESFDTGHATAAQELSTSLRRLRAVAQRTSQPESQQIDWMAAVKDFVDVVNSIDSRVHR